jgi:hypothetical protein
LLKEARAAALGRRGGVVGRGGAPDSVQPVGAAGLQLRRLTGEKDARAAAPGLHGCLVDDLLRCCSACAARLLMAAVVAVSRG